MLSNKLLIATSNPSKKEMFKIMLSNLNVKLVFLDELENLPSPPDENGDTVEDNALIKARFYCKLSGLPTIGDDAGFAIDALDGKPGVMARRWGGTLPDNISDEDWLQYYLKKVSHIKENIFTGSFPFARCLFLPNGQHYFQSGNKKIQLTKNPRRPYKPGWPISSVRIFPDGRHELDIPIDDPVRYVGHDEGLIKLIKKLELYYGK